MNTTIDSETNPVSATTVDVASFLDKDPPEVTEAKALAKRYRMPFIDLLPPEQPSPVDIEELARIPVDLMLRNQFVPLRREGSDLHAAMADPTNLERLDELENVLNVPARAPGISIRACFQAHKYWARMSKQVFGLLELAM